MKLTQRTTRSPEELASEQLFARTIEELLRTRYAGRYSDAVAVMFEMTMALLWNLYEDDEDVKQAVTEAAESWLAVRSGESDTRVH